MTSALRHVLDGGAAQARLLAVDLDLDGRVVELLLELDVAEEGDALHLGGDLFRVLPDQSPGRCRPGERRWASRSRSS